MAAGAACRSWPVPRSTPVLARSRIDRLGSRAREVSGDLNAHAVDSVQGLGEIVAFRHVRARGEEFARQGARTTCAVRMPFLHDLTLQTALQEVATGLGGLAVVARGRGAGGAPGGSTAPSLPLLTLLAMSAFVPVWEIAQVGRQLADTLGAARRVYAVHAEPVPVTDGPGVRADERRVARPGPRDVARELRLSRPPAARARATCRFAVPRGQHRGARRARRARARPRSPASSCASGIPTRASVRLDGHDLREYGLDDLRRRIALVAQDTYLFNDTLRNNVLLARPEADGGRAGGAPSSRRRSTEFVAGAARRARHRRGRARRAALGRPAPARGHRARLPQGRAHPDPRRGDLAPRRGERAGGARRPRSARARPHDAGHRPPAVDGARRRPDHRARRRARGGDRQPRDLLARGGLYAHLVSRQLASASGAPA